jgi:hypothetical protein
MATSNFSKFGRPNGPSSQERKLGYEGVTPKALIYQGGALQQSFRFLLNISGVDVAFITNVSRPSYTIATEEARLLNWSFSYPTTITWEPISFSVKEVFEGYNLQTILGMFYKKLTDYSWNTPSFEEASVGVGDSVGLGYGKDLSKLSLKESLGPINIQSLDSEGNWVEKWTLHGAFITSVKPSQLTYEQDSLTSIDVTVKYDYATLEVANSSQNY